jgi:hypothetical protein
MHTWFWWGNLREGNHLEDSGVDGTIILKWTYEKYSWDRLRIGTGGGIL